MNWTEGEQLVIAGISRMVLKEGKTPHEAIERVRKVESEIFFALMDLKKEDSAQ